MTFLLTLVPATTHAITKIHVRTSKAALSASATAQEMKNAEMTQLPTCLSVNVLSASTTSLAKKDA